MSATGYVPHNVGSYHLGTAMSLGGSSLGYHNVGAISDVEWRPARNIPSARYLTPEDLNPTPEEHMKLTKMSLAKLCVLSDDADEADLDVSYDSALGLTRVRVPAKPPAEKEQFRPERTYLINSNGDGLEVK